jgi:hypothetical protein
MSKTTPIPGFISTAPLAAPAAPEPATTARGPSASPAAGASPVAARSSSLTTGTAGRVSLPGMSMPQATPFARAQQNAASGPQLSPRDAAALFLALIVQNKFGDQNGIAGFAQLLHQGSGAAAAL